MPVLCCRLQSCPPRPEPPGELQNTKTPPTCLRHPTPRPRESLVRPSPFPTSGPGPSTPSGPVWPMGSSEMCLPFEGHRHGRAGASHEGGPVVRGGFSAPCSTPPLPPGIIRSASSFGSYFRQIGRGAHETCGKGTRLFMYYSQSSWFLQGRCNSNKYCTRRRAACCESSDVKGSLGLTDGTRRHLWHGAGVLSGPRVEQGRMGVVQEGSQDVVRSHVSRHR